MPHDPVSNEDLESFYPDVLKTLAALGLAVATVGLFRRHRRRRH